MATGYSPKLQTASDYHLITCLMKSLLSNDSCIYTLYTCISLRAWPAIGCIAQCVQALCICIVHMCRHCRCCAYVLRICICFVHIYVQVLCIYYYVQVEAEGQRLFIRASYDAEIGLQGAQVTRHELRKDFQLPEHIEVDEVSYELNKAGVLEVQILLKDKQQYRCNVTTEEVAVPAAKR